MLLTVLVYAFSAAISAGWCNNKGTEHVLLALSFSLISGLGLSILGTRIAFRYFAGGICIAIAAIADYSCCIKTNPYYSGSLQRAQGLSLGPNSLTLVMALSVLFWLYGLDSVIKRKGRQHFGHKAFFLTGLAFSPVRISWQRRSDSSILSEELGQNYLNELPSVDSLCP
jgi:hypothetical protein